MSNTDNKTHFIVLDNQIVGSVKNPNLIKDLLLLSKETNNKREGGWIVPLITTLVGSLASNIFGKLFHRGKGIQPTEKLKMISKSGKVYDLEPLRNIMMEGNGIYNSGGMIKDLNDSQCERLTRGGMKVARNTLPQSVMTYPAKQTKPYKGKGVVKKMNKTDGLKAQEPMMEIYQELHQ